MGRWKTYAALAALPALLLLLILTGPVACNDKPVVPFTTTQPSTHSQDADGATAAMHPLELFYVPITLTVPTDWEVKPAGHVVFLDGSLPHPVNIPEISLQLNRQASVSADDLDKFLQGARMQAAGNADQTTLIGPKTIGKLTVLQQLTAPRGFTLNSMTQPSTRSSRTPILDWKTWVFVPNRKKGFDRYIMTFTDLDVDSYLANRQFLTSMLDNMQYDDKADVDIKTMDPLK